MGRISASIISYLFHPLLLPTILFTLIYFYSPFLLPYHHPSFILIVFISSFAIPAISMVALYITGAIKSFVMEELNERALPFSYTAILYWMMSYLFFTQFNHHSATTLLIMTISTTISAVAIVNFKFKISAHTAGIAGLIAILIAINFKYPEVNLTYPIVFLIVLSGFIMSARLYLQVHNLKEILIGGLLGFLINFFSVFFLL